MRHSATAEATIHDLSTDGRGVTRMDERVCFVERALPGDRVRVRLDPAAKPSRATVLELLEPSPRPCAASLSARGQCQGSLWGVSDYGQQLHFKHSLIERTLRKAIGDGAGAARRPLAAALGLSQPAVPAASGLKTATRASVFKPARANPSESTSTPASWARRP